MYLVIDIGNTNIKYGLFEQRKLLGSWRTFASLAKSSDEYGIEACSFLQHIGHAPCEVNGIIISSVKVALNYTMEHMCRTYFNMEPRFVDYTLKSNIKILYDDPARLGADRIVNAAGAFELYGGPVITIDFGTATTLGCISEKGEFLGGAICPGIRISTDALVKNAALLPNIEFEKPESVIQRDTIPSMQSGIIYGFVGQVDYILGKMIKEMGHESMNIVATGGMSGIIGAESERINIINSRLTLEGLSILYLQNND